MFQFRIVSIDLRISLGCLKTLFDNVLWGAFFFFFFFRKNVLMQHKCKTVFLRVLCFELFNNVFVLKTENKRRKFYQTKPN
jgi:hypothetical protein